MNRLPLPRILTILAVVALAGWWGIRVASGRPADPRQPFPSPAMDETLAEKSSRQSVVFAGGCFWGVQGVFQHVKGVTKATSGYAGGTTKNPYYELVSSGTTGHAESVEVIYDPSKVTFGTLLKVFFSVAHDPTQKDRQGPDIGTQYRSAIFYKTPEQKQIIEAYIAQINAAKVYDRPIVTQVAPFSAFYEAENYHQDYLNRHPDQPYIRYNDLPKIEHLKANFPEVYR